MKIFHRKYSLITISLSILAFFPGCTTLQLVRFRNITQQKGPLFIIEEYSEAEITNANFTVYGTYANVGRSEGFYIQDVKILFESIEKSLQSSNAYSSVQILTKGSNPQNGAQILYIRLDSVKMGAPWGGCSCLITGNAVLDWVGQQRGGLTKIEADGFSLFWPGARNRAIRRFVTKIGEFMTQP